MLTYSWSASAGKETNPFYGYLWQSTLKSSLFVEHNPHSYLFWGCRWYLWLLSSITLSMFLWLSAVQGSLSGEWPDLPPSLLNLQWAFLFFFFLFDVIFHQFLILEIEVLRGIPENTLTEFFLPSLCCSNSDSSCLLWQITPVSRVTSTLFQGPQVLVDDFKFQFCRTRVLSLGGSMPPSGIRILNE